MLSQRAAAIAWGVSRATLQRAIKSGKLSVLADGSIEPSEMLRAFGEARNGSPSHQNSPLGPASAAAVASLEAQNSSLRMQISAKDIEIAAAEKLITVMENNLEDMRVAMRLIAGPKDQAPQRSLWKKLFGV